MLGKIGIGITTFNRNEILKNTIDRIKQFTKEPFKLVVVDDGNVNPVENSSFRFEKNQGAPIAKNKCLELLDDCEHIFLFDDDTFPIKLGWEDLYINSGIKHLNYTFKFKFKLVNGKLHFENPNGCMIYIHNSVLQKVGGFDTGFIQYGHWHGAYSNRVYNAGLIPHPFIDVMKSWQYIYCMDQDKSNNHRSATRNQGQFLAKNKLRYFEKIDSSEFIPYKKNETPKIWYSNPYNTDKNIGKGLNEFCSLIPDNDWICLQDGDMMYLTPDWGVQIKEAVQRYGNSFGLIGCMTNRLARPIQRVGEFDDNHDILHHYEIAKELLKESYGVVEDVTDKKYIAGLFMLFPKKLWNEIKFAENSPAFDDLFSKAVLKKGYKLGLMKGLYVYHFYRGWSNNPTRDRKHLL